MKDRKLIAEKIEIYIKQKALHVVESFLFGDGGMVDANGGGEVIGYRRWKRNR